jgi:hypothetical protein
MLIAALALPQLAAAGPAQLPPRDLTWNQTGPGEVLLTWKPPIDGSSPDSYLVYRDGDLLGSTAATSFSGVFANVATFSVVAVNGPNHSPPVAVLVGIFPCSPVGVSTYDHPPWVAYSIAPECIQV